MAAISRIIIKIKPGKEDAEKATIFVNEVMPDFVPLVAEQPVRKIFDARWH